MIKIIIALSLLVNLAYAECETFENELECSVKSNMVNLILNNNFKNKKNSKVDILRLNIIKHEEKIKIKVGRKLNQLDININKMPKRMIILINGLRIRIKVKGSK